MLYTLKLYTVNGCSPATVCRVVLPPVLMSLVVSQLLSSPFLCLMTYSMMGAVWLSRGGAQDRFTVREVKDMISGLPGVEGTSAAKIKLYEKKKKTNSKSCVTVSSRLTKPFSRR